MEAEVAVPRLYEDMGSFDECKEVFERVLKVRPLSSIFSLMYQLTNLLTS